MKNLKTHKILIFSCLLAMLVCVTAVSAQTRRSTKLQSKESKQMKKAKAAWTPFYTKFRRAVTNRDRKTLRAMVSDDFEGRSYSIGGIDEHINHWLSKETSALKYKTYPGWREDESIIYKFIRNGNDEVNCSIGFQFRMDEKWYIAFFGCHSE